MPAIKQIICLWPQDLAVVKILNFKLVWRSLDVSLRGGGVGGIRSLPPERKEFSIQKKKNNTSNNKYKAV